MWSSLLCPISEYRVCHSVFNLRHFNADEARVIYTHLEHKPRRSTVWTRECNPLPLCLSCRCPPHVCRPPHWDVWKKSWHAGPLQKGTHTSRQGLMELHSHLSWAHIAFHSPLCIPICFWYSRARKRECCGNESAFQVLCVSPLSYFCLFLLLCLSPQVHSDCARSTAPS